MMIRLLPRKITLPAAKWLPVPPVRRLRKMLFIETWVLELPRKLAHELADPLSFPPMRTLLLTKLNPLELVLES